MELPHRLLSYFEAIRFPLSFVSNSIYFVALYFPRMALFYVGEIKLVEFTVASAPKSVLYFLCTYDWSTTPFSIHGPIYVHDNVVFI